MSLHNLTEQEFNELKKRVRSGVVALGKECGVSHGTTPKRELRSQVGNLASSPYKSKWELTYSKVLDLEQQIGTIRKWKYEGMTLTLAKGKYHRIDFLIWHQDRSIELAQVKGYHPNLRDAMTHLKWAAQLNPWFVWTVKWWTGTGWDSKYVEV